MVSPGCKNCYAKTFAERWRGIPGHAFEQGFDLRLVPEKLGEPTRWANGPGARPIDADWVRSIRDQCLKAGVPFFFKQWGGTRKKLPGRLLELPMTSSRFAQPAIPCP